MRDYDYIFSILYLNKKVTSFNDWICEKIDDVHYQNFWKKISNLAILASPYPNFESGLLQNS